jgi:metallo-beta-lactamase class B
MGRNALRLVLVAAAALAVTAAGKPDPADWTEPQAPFHVVGNVYYVGSRGLAAYLVTTPGGDILLDGTTAANAPMVEANIRKLGFRPRDVKILLNNHAHGDHAGALAQLKADTGAILVASEGDRAALETGRPPSDTSYGLITFPPVKVDRVVKDGETVRLGGVVMTAMLTPGHTPGCTTWTLPVAQAGRRLQVSFLCSITTAGNRLVGNQGYPGIVDDFHRTFARLKTARADVVLTGHPEIADVLGREQRRRSGEADAFVDPSLLGRIVARSQADFEAELAKQQAAAR